MKSMKDRASRRVKKSKFSKILVLLAFALLLGPGLVGTGCATKSTGPDRIDFGSSSQTRGLDAWLGGDSRYVVTSIDEISRGEEAFLLGEARFLEGDLESAFEAYLYQIQRFEGHGLNRYALMRLYELRHDVIDFSNRVAEGLQGVRYETEGTLSRYALARLAHFVSYERWLDGESDEPFSFQHGGAFTQFRATPRLSPWRLLDFDQSFEPEEREQLSVRYKSPTQASGQPANWSMTRTVVHERPAQRLELGLAGIYYLETYLHVEGNRTRTFTLGGQFSGATRIWLNGEQVLEHREEDYESGRYLREIELGPGSHRLLLKVAHDPGSRDWFELFAVPKDGPVFGNQGLSTSFEKEKNSGRARITGEQKSSDFFEPLWPEKESMADLNSATLYVAALSAYASGSTAQFEALLEPLMERHPEAIPLYVLASRQVQTRQEVPLELRDAMAMTLLRRAEELAPENLFILVELERRLRDTGGDRELRELMDRARASTLEVGHLAAGQQNGQARQVRQIRPLVTWARHLERKGWTEDAEEAWRHVLGVDPKNCLAANQLFGLYRNRNYQPSLEQITPEFQRCQRLRENYISTDPRRVDEVLQEARRQANRFPFDGEKQRAFAEALRSQGNLEEALNVVNSGLERRPDSWALWEAKLELHLGMNDRDGARQTLQEAARQNVRTAALDWRLARLEDRIPLVDLMHDGHRLAMAEVRRSGTQERLEGEEAEVIQASEESAIALDDAYFVLDFRGSQFFEDGATWTLTHQVVRVMTRGAISRYAEISIPNNAQLLLARTIKEDGEVRVPEEVPGKETLSMPGLAEGDMVEIAYLQFHRPREIAAHYEGPTFFFQRSTISSRQSELVVVNPGDLRFESENGAPEPESFEVGGEPALRFLARDVRHPRSEPRTVGSLEFLPWVRPYRDGLDMHALDAERRYQSNSLLESAKYSSTLDREVRSWLGRTTEGPVQDQEVKALFYAVAGLFANPSAGSFQFDASYAVQLRRGSPIVVLHSILNHLGVENQVYLGRSDENPPLRLALSEIRRFESPLLKVRLPQSGEVYWLEMNRMDAMFGAVEASLVGQPALCVSCEDYNEETVTVPEELRPYRNVELRGALDESGTLQGQLNYHFKGTRAVVVRSALRSRPDEEDRRQYLERILTSEIEGAELESFVIHGAEDRWNPLELEITFRRPGFARRSGDQMVIDRVLFEEALERIYATTASRELPLFVGYEREQSYSLHLQLPEGAGQSLRDGLPRLRARDLEVENDFGSFSRRTWLDDRTLRIETAVQLPRQRIRPELYQDFRQWCRAVEESAALELQF